MKLLYFYREAALPINYGINGQKPVPLTQWNGYSFPFVKFSTIIVKNCDPIDNG